MKNLSAAFLLILFFFTGCMKESDVPDGPCDGMIEKVYSRNYDGAVTLCDSNKSAVAAKVFIRRVTYGEIAVVLISDSLALDTTLHYNIKCQSISNEPSVKLYDEALTEKGYYDVVK